MYQKLFIFVTIASIVNINYGTPLDDYVNEPDPAWSWELLQTYPSSTYTVYILNMTSQRWFQSSFSSQSIWWHYMIVTVPKILRRSKNAFLFLGGGNNTTPMPTESFTIEFAVDTGSVTVDITHTLNQPIIFMADPLKLNRSEDSIIAYLWRMFIETNGSDPHLLPRLPMTKAAVRAMDTTQQFLRQQQIQVPDKFVVSGVSKLGWTGKLLLRSYISAFRIAWLTAAVDNTRVIAAIPIVLDMVNLRQHMKHQYQSLDGWTFGFSDYYVQNITRLLDNPYFQSIADIVDPYVYFDRYRNVKIMQFQGSIDQMFPPDSEDFFWDDLQKATGGSFLRRIPNAQHGMWGYNESLASFYMSICDEEVLPLWTWTRTTNETHGEICANVSIGDGHPTPINVTVFQARTVNGTKRDFRFAKVDPNTGKVVPNPVVWLEMNDIEIERVGQSITYTYITSTPPDGHWDGLFMQATFPGPENKTLILTTETLIIPNTYPVAPCSGEGCYGTLV